MPEKGAPWLRKSDLSEILGEAWPAEPEGFSLLRQFVAASQSGRDLDPETLRLVAEAFALILDGADARDALRLKGNRVGRRRTERMVVRDVGIVLELIEHRRRRVLVEDAIEGVCAKFGVGEEVVRKLYKRHVTRR